MIKYVITAFMALFVSGCVSLVATYDYTFDQALNKLSEDTAKFTAAAAAGGPERFANSRETTVYYATTYNVLDRLSQRASLTRGSVPCPTNASLTKLQSERTSASRLPEDYQNFDCREFQLYMVRFYVDQLKYGHVNDGLLNKAEARLLGNVLQTSILGAIQTFVVNKT